MISNSQLVLGYYGDDFTGSTDVLESLSLAGLQAMLFLEAPSPDVLDRYPHVQAVGMAGISRSLQRDEMEAELGPAFAALHGLGAPLVHYKVCSTFDSSPEIGSIGRAIEIGKQVFDSPIVPVVTGAPVLGRFCAFGNLFARSGLDSPVYRLDRHPTMSVHPTTPMDESDLRLVLGRQTDRPVGIIDLDTLARGYDEVVAQWQQLKAERVSIVVVDTMSDEQLPVVGRFLSDLVAEARGRADADGCRPAFVVGSSGVEYALSAHWRQTGELPAQPPPGRLPAAQQIACVSGSCSPVTARQIDYALEHGFAEVAVDPVALAGARSSAEVDRCVQLAKEHVSQGRSVLIHSSRGPDDPRIAQMREYLQAGGNAACTAEVIGDALGLLLRGLVETTDLKRFVVTGGDTSGFVGRRLGIEALSYVGPVAPGAPLCRIHARPQDPLCADLEIAFKGGQVGHPDFLLRVRDGNA